MVWQIMNALPSLYLLSWKRGNYSCSVSVKSGLGCISVFVHNALGMQ